MLKIGLSMNVSWGMEDRPRDCIARAWDEVLAPAMPEMVWVPIPNLGMGRTRKYLRTLELDGIILTGAGTLGQDSQRDQSELDLLEVAMRDSLPLLAVGRGLLLLQTRFGGDLEPLGNGRSHEHEVHLSDLPFCRHRYRRLSVNSSHTATITKLAKGLLPFAVDGNGWVEGAYHESHRICGIMWNPEQAGAPRDFDATLLRALFRYSD